MMSGGMMRRILVLYGTTDGGHTAKIATFFGDTLKEWGFDVDVVDARSARSRPEDYHGIVVAASVHGGTYQRAVRHWVSAHPDGLQGNPLRSFLSVWPSCRQSLKCSGR
jgi:menaquinone-dependent protoporphyrinogen oxidase